MVRFVSGIGAISNLSNTFPWGFWISFDIYTGIAISSGAFLLAAAVYVLDLPQFKPLVMPSILTALIGYIMEVLALMVDLGRPERIFNMLFFQNYTSWMLVVGLCVMIYLAILAVEFAPVVFKGIKQEKWAALPAARQPLSSWAWWSPSFTRARWLVTYSSSLQTCILWWTPLLPVMFFVVHSIGWR
jgi:Ni/Fe-hydrogenase subunit HybB-like protein